MTPPIHLRHEHWFGSEFAPCGHSLRFGWVTDDYDEATCSRCRFEFRCALREERE